jgi:hypothetical protein
MDAVTIAGTIGAVIILVLFLLNQFKLLSVDNVWYDLGNVVGGFILLIYSYLIMSIPFILINAVWTFFSLRDVVYSFKRK